MEKPLSTTPDGSQELQCVGKLEIVRAKPVGFLCGSIPVPTDKAFNSFDSALVPSTPTSERAPRYRVIPTETDLNTLPLLPNIPEKVLPMVAAHSRSGGDLPYESGAIASNLSRKGEALAVSGVAEYGDEIDVIAPTDILKQIFKIPYSKARLSIAVHRIGQTLVLNTGPDVEEGEKLVRRHNQSQCVEKSLFLNFAMHSVRMEACDCPPAQHARSEEQPKSSFLPGRSESRDTHHAAQAYTSQYFGQHDDIVQEEGYNHSEYPQVKQDSFFWERKKNKRSKGHEAVKKVSHVKEKPRSSMQESEYRRISTDGFLRVLFWQFNNFRMLLGSDLLIFSNEKYIAVSLHLWDVSRQVTPLTWLEAWLDNVMASVPELAICYHQNGVVQGYELLKTDDIFLTKGVSDDGSPAFHPHVVQQNGHSVLRFLQENCKQDPGAYWLYKSAGEDVIQLFDLSAIPKSCSTTNCDDSSSSLPSLIHRGRSDSLLSLGTLLYRIAHRLSLSMSPQNRARCAKFFKKCLDFLDQPDHLVVRAFAHEQFARLLLDYNENLDLTSEVLPVESEARVADADKESYECFSGISELIVHEIFNSVVVEDDPSQDSETIEDSGSEVSVKRCLDTDASAFRTLLTSNEAESRDAVIVSSCSDQISTTTPVIHTIVDPISSKLAAIHHVSQAIKSLRWKRQLRSTENGGQTENRSPFSTDFSVCACGDADCIEVCDIREWLPTSKLDDKLWKLVLLLGESYLALGEAYKDDGQLPQVFKVVELACLVYGSMPQHLEDTKFISSMFCNSLPGIDINDRRNKTKSMAADYLFWAKAWTLVGDVYVEFHRIKDKVISMKTEKKPFTRELRMSSEVLKELGRLKKKLGKFNQNCSLCSLVNCSCQSDRASSGSSASSSSGGTRPFNYGRKQSEKSYSKSVSHSLLGKPADVATMDMQNLRSTEAENEDAKLSTVTETNSSETMVKNGGIFKYLHGHVTVDADYNLIAALSCYEEARKALGGHPSSSAELQSLFKKKGWVCNEMGRNRLERKELVEAELAFVEAVNSFKRVSDHSNVILINCNLGHGRRALAEGMVSEIENLRKHPMFHNAYKQALERAKSEYGESLRYYAAAKKELNDIDEEEVGALSDNLKNEVYTQFAHTYLRLGMLLARENTCAKVYNAKKEFGKHEISANDAISEALCMYELLGELRKQEAAYAYFQLACFQRDCCLRFLESDQKKSNASKGENSGIQRVKQYFSLAERNWQKSIEFYGPKTHPMMYLTILIERSALSSRLSRASHFNAMLESALIMLLEGRRISEGKVPNSLRNDDSKVYEKFWSQLQMLLKKMLGVGVALPNSTNKSSSASSKQNQPSNSEDVRKLKELYRLSLKATDFSQLHAMHRLWMS